MSPFNGSQNNEAHWVFRRYAKEPPINVSYEYVRLFPYNDISLLLATLDTNNDTNDEDTSADGDVNHRSVKTLMAVATDNLVKDLGMYIYDRKPVLK